MVDCQYRLVCRYADTDKCLECENNKKKSYFEPAYGYYYYESNYYSYPPEISGIEPAVTVVYNG